MIGFQTGFKRIIGLSITAAFVSSSTIYSDYLSPNRKQLLYAYNHPGVYVWGPNHHKLIDANNQPIHAPKLMPVIYSY
ncbi:hypothetical protein BC833DRAFT_602333 [Globomyces pollinis-pini]|nr:hypothetical protein BC833DRAFT_602333 [Globomyces pollinis-pini]